MDYKIFSKKIEDDFKKNIGIELSDDDRLCFYIFMNMLIAKNKVMNLTAITDPEEIIMRHFVDSCMLIKFYDFDAIKARNNGTIRAVDIGTGAGFPGIPLAIVLKNVDFVLTDSLGKRIKFLEEAVEAIRNVAVGDASMKCDGKGSDGGNASNEIGSGKGCDAGNRSIGNGAGNGGYGGNASGNVGAGMDMSDKDKCGSKGSGDACGIGGVSSMSGVGGESSTNGALVDASIKPRLQNVTIINTRAEDFGANLQYRESFDFAFSRGVAKLSVLAEYSLPTLKVDGKMIAYKMDDIDAELSESKSAISTLGGMFHVKHSYSLFDGEPKRCLLEIEKVSKTPKKYPRKPGIPGKSPL